MKGTRVELVAQEGGFQILKPGEYGKWEDGTWYACCPSGDLANLASHAVTENADSTITVSPSILVRDSTKELWHGYLENGIWRAV